MSTRLPPRRALVAVTTLVVAFGGTSARACDICAIYTATEQRESRTGFRLGIAEQYTYFGTELDNGHEVTLPAKEWMESSVTQLLFGYTVSPRVSFQLNLPLIVRDYRRIHDHRIQHGNTSGVGDMALVANVLAFSRVSESGVFRFSLLGGVKFPTGNPDLLAEELEEPATGAVRLRAAAPRHADGTSSPDTNGLPAQGGLHGHDLALGSGSWDGIVGAQWFWSWSRAYLASSLQYAIRTTGAFDYRYANDLTWVGGPGYFVLLEHGYTVGVEAVLSGETKGKDTQGGTKADDTAMTALYVGPGVTLTWGTSLAADLAVDIPVYQHDTSLQLVPDARVRGGLTWRF